MNFLNALLVGLLRLPFKVRLTVVMLSFLVCFVLCFFSQFNGPLLAIPLALAVWFFKRRNAYMSTAFAIFGLAVAVTIGNHGFFWPHTLIQGFFTGTVALLTESLFICYQRYLLDVADDARLRALQAEQQKLIAYEQQMKALQANKLITNAYEQQRQINQLKDSFIVNVSHELRTPVQAVLGYIELLQNFDGQLDTAVRVHCLVQAFRTCQELRSLVNNVLDTVQISSGKQSPIVEAFPVIQIVQDVLTLVEPEKLQQISLRLDVPEHLKVMADPHYTRQVILNLLMNALKYCSVSDSVIISAGRCEATEPESEPSLQVCICVKDTGPGIPAEELPFLFERFVRLKRDLAGPVHGSGLGLSISKELVEAMGGRIWVESSGIPGQGSSFYFTLPYVP